MYARFLKFQLRHPALTAAATGASVMACGDALAQRIVEERPNLDVSRNAAAACYNGAVLPSIFEPAHA